MMVEKGVNLYLNDDFTIEVIAVFCCQAMSG